MVERREYSLLVGILLLILVIRLFFAFKSQAFAYDGYSILKQVQYSGHFLDFYDPLSYGGRQFVFLPIFPFTLALLGAFFPVWWIAKIMPNVFSTLASLFVYLILVQLTKHKGVALFTAFAAGLFPLLLKATVNSVSPYTMSLPFLLACVYWYICARNDEKKMNVLLGLIIVFPFIHPSALFFMGGLFFYWLLCIAQGLVQKKTEKEIFLFGILYTLWVLFLFYKKALLMHGFGIIWQNIPSVVLDSYFEPLSMLSSFGAIGILPIILGTYMVYRNTSTKATAEWNLIIGFAVFFFVLITLKLLEPVVGLLFLGIFLFLLCGQFFCFALEYLEKTKFAEYKNAIIISFCIIFMFSLFVVPQEKNQPSMALLNALQWLHRNSASQETVLGTVEQGHLITTIAERKNVWDTSFLLIPAIEQRANDVMQIYQTASEVAAVGLLSKYGVNYVVLSPSAQKQYSIKELAYAKDEKCFAKAYENEEINIFKVLCGVRQQ